MSLRYGQGMKRTSLLPITLMSTAALLLAGCGDSSDEATASTDATVQIVASTNVYGDIAEVIAGDKAEVTSLITSAAQDPHSFEASAQDQLAISKADVIIENGGGYDPFIDTLLEASDNADATVLNAVDISALSGAGEEGFNEHVFYSFPAMDQVAQSIATELGTLDPDDKASFQSNYDAFAEKLAGLEAQADDLKAEYGGAGVAVTEPVPVYLLEAAGLVNKTPAEFSESVEEGTDLSPRVLAETLDLFADGEVEMLAYNDQVSSTETEQVRAAAESADVAVVNFTETLPDGQDYLAWMSANLDGVSGALG